MNSGVQAGNIGDHCPFCRTPWELVELVVISLNKALEDAKRIRKHVVSLVEAKTTPF
jgi:hypothetical protein